LAPSNRLAPPLNSAEIQPSGTAPRITEALPIWPVAAPASAEAVVKEHSAAKDASPAQATYELPNESNGVELDHIPYTGDEAILLDDLPRAEPVEPKAKSHATASSEMLPTRAEMQITTETENADLPDAALSESATRAYLAERSIAGLRMQPPATKPEMVDTAPENMPRVADEAGVQPMTSNQPLKKQV
jgi:hypothetical protein